MKRTKAYSIREDLIEKIEKLAAKKELPKSVIVNIALDNFFKGSKSENND